MGAELDPGATRRRGDGPRGRRGRVLLGVLLALALAACAAASVAILTRGSDRSPQPPARLPAVSSARLVEASSAVRDAAGERWAPDPYSKGGGLLTESVPISDTSSPALYQHERVGVRSLDVPLRSAGPYLVVLYFAETAGARPGRRAFEVIAQGRTVARVDIAGEVGALAPYHLAFTLRAPDRRLAIRFRALRGKPVLSALRIEPVSANVQLPGSRLAFSDQFDGASGSPPDPARWGYDLGRGWGQRARYTSSTANAHLDGHGDLVLAAIRRSGEVTSARLTTRGRFAMGYGTAAARLRVAGTPGVVSTFWALGADVAAVGWPSAGEIDAVEVRGLEPKLLLQAVHTACGQEPCPVIWEQALPQALSDGFHTFTVQRAPGVLIYQLDGRQTASLTSADLRRGSWVFDKRFSLILNLIVGGWGGSTQPGAHWPITMLVDWVKVFE